MTSDRGTGQDRIELVQFSTVSTVPTISGLSPRGKEVIAMKLYLSSTKLIKLLNGPAWIPCFVDLCVYLPNRA